MKIKSDTQNGKEQLKCQTNAKKKSKNLNLTSAEANIVERTAPNANGMRIHCPDDNLESPYLQEQYGK